MPNSSCQILAFTILVTGCSSLPEVADPADPATTVDMVEPGAGALALFPDAPVVPLYALVPSGPDDARLLWVPWPGTDARYTVERRGVDATEWLSVVADVHRDYAVVHRLSDGDQLRVVARSVDGSRSVESVPLPFHPASATPSRIQGRAVIDGRGQAWQLGATTVAGWGPVPAPGDVLVPAIQAPNPSAGLREALTVSGDAEGWLATTRAFDFAPAAGTRLGAALNLSMDGVPSSVFEPTQAGKVGYCSSSGWGCLELSESDLHRLTEAADVDPSPERAAYEGDWPATMSAQMTAAGMDIDAVATGGVRVFADYELGWTSLNSASLVTEPYAVGQVAANISTSGGSIPDFEQPLITSISVPLYSAGLVSITADFGLAAIAELDNIGGGAIDGAWTGDVEFSRPTTVGYQSRNSRGLYGPVLGDPYFDIGITPAFADGSSADIWFAWRASGSVVLQGGFWEIARGTLAATAGLVFAHESTPGAPCNEAISIAHADVALRAKLDAEIDFLGLDPYEFPLADRRKVLLSWGRPRYLAGDSRVTSGEPIEFRTLAGAPDFVYRDVTADPSSLTTFVDGAVNPSPVIVANARYSVDLPAGLSDGDHTLSVWLPDDPPALPSIQTLLDGHGQCTSRTFSLDPAQ